MSTSIFEHRLALEVLEVNLFSIAGQGLVVVYFLASIHDFSVLRSVIICIVHDAKIQLFLILQK